MSGAAARTGGLRKNKKKKLYKMCIWKLNFSTIDVKWGIHKRQ